MPMSAQKEEYLKETKSIFLHHMKDQPIKVILFGSWATGKMQNISDIDVALLSEKNIAPEILNPLRHDLEESCIPYPVEIVDLSRTDEKFKQRVLETGILWKD